MRGDNNSLTLEGYDINLVSRDCKKAQDPQKS